MVLPLVNLCADQVQILKAGFEIEPAGRFVQHQDWRIVNQRSAEKKPPLLPCREMLEGARGERFDA
jgi:hypothetical protein